MPREAGQKKQHVVSKVLLEQFVRAGRLRELGYPTRIGMALVDPGASGYVPSFVRLDAAPIEARWKDVEDRVQDALAVHQAAGAVRAGYPTEATITGLLASHCTGRSRVVRDEADRIYLNVRAASQARLADHPNVLDRIHYGRTGLLAAGPKARQEVNDRLHQGPPHVTSDAERVVYFYEQALAPLRQLPAQTVRRHRRRP